MSLLWYLANSLAWSGLGLIAGAALTQVGIDIGSLLRRHR